MGSEASTAASPGGILQPGFLAALYQTRERRSSTRDTPPAPRPAHRAHRRLNGAGGFYLPALPCKPIPLCAELAFVAAAAAANVAGGLAVVARRHWNEMFLKYFLGLGAGFMLAATFLRMLPESMRLTEHAPLLFLGGYFLVHFFEHTVAPHFHFGEERHDDLMVNPAVGISALVGLSIHTFFDGVSIASGFLISAPLGLLIFFAVVLPDPEGVTVASIALASAGGSSRR